MTAQEITVGPVPALAMRVTFVGELGWEAATRPASTARPLWETLWAEGEPDGMVAAGYRAIDSMRVEKSYRVWASDLTAETTPDEAGLGLLRARLTSPAGSRGARRCWPPASRG